MRDRAGVFLALWIAPWSLGLPTAAVAAEPKNCCCAATADDCHGYVQDGELEGWLERLRVPRFTGNEAHNELIRYLEDKLWEIGEDGESVLVERRDRSFTRWAPSPLEAPAIEDRNSRVLAGKACAGALFRIHRFGGCDRRADIWWDDQVIAVPLREGEARRKDRRRGDSTLSAKGGVVSSIWPRPAALGKIWDRPIPAGNCP